MVLPVVVLVPDLWMRGGRGNTICDLNVISPLVVNAATQSFKAPNLITLGEPHRNQNDKRY